MVVLGVVVISKGCLKERKAFLLELHHGCMQALHHANHFALLLVNSLDRLRVHVFALLHETHSLSHAVLAGFLFCQVVRVGLHLV